MGKRALEDVKHDCCTTMQQHVRRFRGHLLSRMSGTVRVTEEVERMNHTLLNKHVQRTMQ